MKRHRYSLDTARRRSGMTTKQVDLLLESGLVRGRWDSYGWSTTPAELLMAWNHSEFSNSTPHRGRESKGKPGAYSSSSKGGHMPNELPEEFKVKAANILAATGVDVLETFKEAYAAGGCRPYEPAPPTPRQMFRAALGLKKTGDSLRDSDPELARQILKLARERLTAASKAAAR